MIAAVRNMPAGKQATSERRRADTCSVCGRMFVQTYQNGRCYDCQTAHMSKFRSMLEDTVMRAHPGDSK